ncbi:MAG: UDP-N-acetylmuramoyl-tripeptide--D-alanyl-D-alanine ligase [Syntrophorhabdus sp. PtaU1.Bin002]|nr:MAG: UDP-N-acetylmuramoyl-tripeptide--D-alanyl-D-alanine ligase [Syntrophorhabdus sp. PtaU1.Bin002]
MWSVDEVVEAVRGVPFRVERRVFPDISTDSRDIEEGELFVPITGKTFDGHLFIGAAYERSHGGALCEKGRKDILDGVDGTKGTVILVGDTTQALLDLAHYKRVRTKGTFIALTGSNGKTTTKEILVRIIGGAHPVHYNEKNYNNLIGVSKSILSIKGTPEFFVFELGTNSRGEIRQLAEVTEPDVALITNINPSHLQGLGDLEGVLEEKLDLFRLTKEGGKVMVNADDPHLLPRYRDKGHDLRTFGIVNEADFRLTVDEDLGWDGYVFTIDFLGDSVKAKTSLLGKHNLYNILSASSIAYVAGIDTMHIGEAVESFSPYGMRFRPVKSSKGYIIVDDSYNANPSSMEWAVSTLSGLPCPGKRFAIVGDMKELGEKTSYYHKELGRFLKKSGVDQIMLIGDEVKEAFTELDDGRARLFESKPSLIDYAKKLLSDGDVVLVKGSRTAKMEEIVEALI